MPEKRPDRRVRRTRKRLKGALLALIEERDYESITVEHITERADIARSTFYTHYASKEELLFSGFDEWLVGLSERGEGASQESPGRPSSAFRFSLPLLRHMNTQRRFVRALLLAPEARLRRRVTRLIAAVALEELSRGVGAERADRLREAQAQVVAGAFLGLAAWWITSGRGLSAEDVDEIFQQTLGRAAPCG